MAYRGLELRWSATSKDGDILDAGGMIDSTRISGLLIGLRGETPHQITISSGKLKRVFTVTEMKKLVLKEEECADA